MSSRSILHYLLRRAATDFSFRENLLHDPRSALEAELGLELPVDFTIRFIEAAGADVTIVLPDPVSPDELGEHELSESVGGAHSWLLESMLQSLLDTNPPRTGTYHLF